MDINTLQKYFERLSADEMALLYSGNFADDVTSQVIGLSNAQFDDGSDLNKTQRKTGFLIAECFQNIVRHNESSVENGFFLTRNDGGILYIASGNIIKDEMVSELTGKLEHLNRLSKEELKEVYLKTLSNNEISEKGGAGLGLIEMARKTGNQLKFEFLPIRNGLSYFYFQLKFKVTKDVEDADPNHDIYHSMDLRKQMLADQLFLLYQGDVSMNTIMPILTMVEKSLAKSSAELKTLKVVYIAMLEFFQNMSKHGMNYDGQQKGLILIGERDGRYIVGGSNYIDDREHAILTEKLGLYADMELEKLNEEYKRILKHGDPDNKEGASLGIIEMARRSSKPIEYNFTEYNGHQMVNILLQI